MPFRRIRETASSITETSQLTSALILDLSELVDKLEKDGVEFSLKVGDKEFPVSLKLKIPKV